MKQRMKLPRGMSLYGVTTTGVYCVPSCPARKPLPKNVRFFENAAAAEAAGLRACLRCRPKEQPPVHLHAARIREACEYIDAHLDDTIALGELACRASMSRFHFQRTFKSVVGVTPKHYQDAARLRAFKAALRSGGNVTDAVYDAGYATSSLIYGKAGASLGMTPKQYRHDGKGVAITHATIETALGLLMIGATDRGLCFIQFGDSRTELEQRLRREYSQAQITAMKKPASNEMAQWTAALQAHLRGVQPALDVPLDVRATAFQMRVWLYLQKIPYGEVRSYAEVAAAIGQPKAARAVARACASNVVALAIPCHRVIRGSGELGGYRWGLARKRVLIDGERAAARA